jgi:hypothetical protein
VRPSHTLDQELQPAVACCSSDWSQLLSPKTTSRTPTINSRWKTGRLNTGILTLHRQAHQSKVIAASLLLLLPPPL